MDPGHALHVRVTRSPEHYQPLCMPDASTLTCTRTRVYAFICVCVRLYVYVCTRRAADSTGTYVNTYGRYIGIGMYIPGGVPFERRQWAFDTTRSIERLVFSVSGRYLSGR